MLLQQDAEYVNNAWYSKLSGVERTYHAYYDGKWNDSPVEHTISLKEGCKVLICANDPEGSYVNGDKGVVLCMDPNGVLVKLENGKEVYVTKFRWEKYKYSRIGGSLCKDVESMFEQIPIRLGMLSLYTRVKV